MSLDRLKTCLYHLILLVFILSHSLIHFANYSTKPNSEEMLKVLKFSLLILFNPMIYLVRNNVDGIHKDLSPMTVKNHCK